MPKSLKYYTDYWDDVVKCWLGGTIAPQQQLFLNEKWLKLSPLDIPEPYWGDPENCSMVIANYNPGGGGYRSRHTYRECACCPESFINQVKQKGYYQVAKDFPIIDEPGLPYDPLKSVVCWWKEYGGRKWWLKVMKWIQENIPEAFQEDSQKFLKKPFAIEFCGWHSVGWPASSCVKLYKKSKDLKSAIKKTFIMPLVDAVHNSDMQLGICVGSQFYYLFEEMAKSCSNIKKVCSCGPALKGINIHLFCISGELILVLWGEGRNRYANVGADKIKSFLAHSFQALEKDSCPCLNSKFLTLLNKWNISKQ